MGSNFIEWGTKRKLTVIDNSFVTNWPAGSNAAKETVATKECQASNQSQYFKSAEHVLWVKKNNVISHSCHDIILSNHWWATFVLEKHSPGLWRNRSTAQVLLEKNVKNTQQWNY